MMISRRLGMVCLVSMLSTGCVSIKSNRLSGPVIPTAGTSRHVDETRDGGIQAAAELDGSIVRVEAIRTRECRTVEVTPTEQEITHEKSMSGGGTAGVVFIGLGGAALVGMGIAGVLSTCPPVTGIDKDGNSLQNECLGVDEENQQTYNVGGGVM